MYLALRVPHCGFCCSGGMSSSADLGQFPADSKRVALPPPPPRLSPDFRNGDFLSRLLAATPPYLYNIPMVPHSFFFSDMLKSFVQGSKPPEPPREPPALQDFPPPSAEPAVPAKDLPGRPPHRRRKRTWREMSEPPRFLIDRKPPPPPPMDKPLELTNNNRSAPSTDDSNAKRRENSPARLLSPPLERSSPAQNTESPPTLPPLMQLQPSMPHCGMLPLPGPDFLHGRLGPSSDPMSNELMPSLPPFPPPMWYPSLYPGLGPNMPPQHPYGIDPLHFFIDLRVSGHIWDRKPPFGTAGVHHQGSPTGLDCTIDKERGSPHGEVSSSRLTELDKDNEDQVSGPLNLASPSSSACKPSLGLLLGNGSKHNKHTSAFSVPEPRPLMMTTKNARKAIAENRKKLPTTNYVLQNLSRIYEEMQKPAEEQEEMQKPAEEEQEEEKTAEAPCKDLPALIGLELVVDYVKHEAKPGQPPPPADPPGDAKPAELAPSPPPASP